MKKVTIKKASDLSILQVAKFEDDKTMNEWVEMLAVNHPFGKPEHKIEVTPARTIYHEAVPAVLDEEGEELEPAVEAYTEVIEATFEVVPSEYLVEIEDITAQVNQEKINQEAEQYLAVTDWYVIRMMDSGVVIPDEVVQLRQQARNRIIR